MLLVHLNDYEDTVKHQGGISYNNFFTSRPIAGITKTANRKSTQHSWRPGRGFRARDC